MNRLTEKIEDGFYVAPNIHNADELKYKLGKLEDLLEKYEIEDLSELEIALDYYYHRYDKVETRRVDSNDI